MMAVNSMPRFLAFDSRKNNSALMCLIDVILS